jgi:hypothetical protein
MLPTELIITVGEHCDILTKAKLYKAFGIYDIQCRDINRSSNDALSECAICHKIACIFCSNDVETKRCYKCCIKIYGEGHMYTGNVIYTCTNIGTVNIFCKTCLKNRDMPHQCLIRCGISPCLFTITNFFGPLEQCFVDCDNTECSKRVCRDCIINNNERFVSQCGKPEGGIHIQCTKCSPGKHSACIECKAMECALCDTFLNTRVLLDMCFNNGCSNVICKSCAVSNTKFWADCTNRSQDTPTSVYQNREYKHLYCGRCEIKTDIRCHKCNIQKCCFFSSRHTVFFEKCGNSSCNKFVCDDCAEQDEHGGLAFYRDSEGVEYIYCSPECKLALIT